MRLVEVGGCWMRAVHTPVAGYLPSPVAVPRTDAAVASGALLIPAAAVHSEFSAAPSLPQLRGVSYTPSRAGRVLLLCGSGRRYGRACVDEVA